ncbi:unnamed protein product [Blepharisma stoltei]|uniref:Uncharacterized protein n=1 Tax=Blepharisma stoltei TaxID=1481888 RepID=A0AAU9K4P9_9CILI|nr:unnamed protein product [Blepharisma stoltei]
MSESQLASNIIQLLSGTIDRFNIEEKILSLISASDLGSPELSIHLTAGSTSLIASFTSRTIEIIQSYIDNFELNSALKISEKFMAFLTKYNLLVPEINIEMKLLLGEIAKSENKLGLLKKCQQDALKLAKENPSCRVKIPEIYLRVCTLYLENENIDKAISKAKKSVSFAEHLLNIDSNENKGVIQCLVDAASILCVIRINQDNNGQAEQWYNYIRQLEEKYEINEENSQYLQYIRSQFPNENSSIKASEERFGKGNGRKVQSNATQNNKKNMKLPGLKSNSDIYKQDQKLSHSRGAELKKLHEIQQKNMLIPIDNTAAFMLNSGKELNPALKYLNDPTINRARDPSPHMTDRLQSKEILTDNKISQDGNLDEESEEDSETTAMINKEETKASDEIALSQKKTNIWSKEDLLTTPIIEANGYSSITSIPKNEGSLDSSIENKSISEENQFTLEKIDFTKEKTLSNKEDKIEKTLGFDEKIYLLNEKNSIITQSIMRADSKNDKKIDTEPMSPQFPIGNLHEENNYPKSDAIKEEKDGKRESEPVEKSFVSQISIIHLNEETTSLLNNEVEETKSTKKDNHNFNEKNTLLLSHEPEADGSAKKNNHNNKETTLLIKQDQKDKITQKSYSSKRLQVSKITEEVKNISRLSPQPGISSLSNPKNNKIAEKSSKQEPEAKTPLNKATSKELPIRVSPTPPKITKPEENPTVRQQRVSLTSSKNLPNPPSIKELQPISKENKPNSPSFNNPFPSSTDISQTAGTSIRNPPNLNSYISPISEENFEFWSSPAAKSEDIAKALLLIQSCIRRYKDYKRFKGRKIKNQLLKEYIAFGKKEFNGVLYFITVTEEGLSQKTFKDLGGQQGGKLAKSNVIVDAIPLVSGVVKPKYSCYSEGEICEMLGIWKFDELIGIYQTKLIEIVEIKYGFVVLGTAETKEKPRRRLLYRGRSKLKSENFYFVRIYELDFGGKEQISILATNPQESKELNMSFSNLLSLLNVRKREMLQDNLSKVVDLLYFDSEKLCITDPV